MAEEQPNFKVTDRRLFNADGSPRELAPEEKPEPQAAVAQEAAAVAPAPEPEAQPETEVPVSAGATSAEAEEEFSEEDWRVRLSLFVGTKHLEELENPSSLLGPVFWLQLSRSLQ